jgi:hypothetical protein
MFKNFFRVDIFFGTRQAERQNAELKNIASSAQDRGPNNPCPGEVKGQIQKKINRLNPGRLVILSRGRLCISPHNSRPQRLSARPRQGHFHARHQIHQIKPGRDQGSGLRKRRSKLDLEEFLAIDQKRRDLLLETEELKARRNQASGEMARMKKPARTRNPCWPN